MKVVGHCFDRGFSHPLFIVLARFIDRLLQHVVDIHVARIFTFSLALMVELNF